MKRLTLFVLIMFLASCATPPRNAQDLRGRPCPTYAGTTLAQNPFAATLMKIGGNLLATAAANYSQHYGQELGKLLGNLVTPKQKKKPQEASNGSNQGSGEQGAYDPYQNDPYAGDQGQAPGLSEQQGAYDSYQNNPYAGDQGQPYPADPGLSEQSAYDPNAFPEDQLEEVGHEEGAFPAETAGESPPGGDLNVEEGGAETIQNAEVDPQVDPNLSEEPISRGVPGPYDMSQAQEIPCVPNNGAQPAEPYYAGGSNQGYPYDPNAGYPATGQPYSNQPTSEYSYDPNANTQPYSEQSADAPYSIYPAQTDPYVAGGPAQGSPYDPNTGYPATGHPSSNQSGGEYPYDQNASTQPSYEQPVPGQTEPAYNPSPTSEFGQPQQGHPIGLDVVLVRKAIRNGAPIVVPIQDGEVLKDGRGNPQAGDKFRIMFRSNSDSYVYVIAIDGSGWAQGVFPPPSAPLSNPVTKDKQYVIPGGSNWFSLDQFRGVETIFFVASRAPRRDIEDILKGITGRERPATATPRQVTKAAIIPHGFGGTRASQTPFGLTLASGEEQHILPTSFFARTAGEDLRVTRWFRHQ